MHIYSSICARFCSLFIFPEEQCQWCKDPSPLYSWTGWVCSPHSSVPCLEVCSFTNYIQFGWLLYSSVFELLRCFVWRVLRFNCCVFKGRVMLESEHTSWKKPWFSKSYIVESEISMAFLPQPRRLCFQQCHVVGWLVGWLVGQQNYTKANGQLLSYLNIWL